MDSKSIFFIVGVIIILSYTQLGSASTNTNTMEGSAAHIRKRRLRADGKPVLVNMKAHVLDIEAVNCLNMEMTVELYLEHVWQDPQFIDGGKEEASRSKESKEELWIPDTYIVNAREYKMRKQDIMPTSNPGEIERSGIITVTTKCPMDFTLYPFDHQKCSIEVESYSYTSDDVQYKWTAGQNDNEKVVDIAPSAKAVLPFEVMDIRNGALNVSYLNESYSRVVIDIYFRRHWNTYLESFYVPMTFFLSLSLLSLWLVYPKVSAIVNFFNVSLVNIFIQLYQTNSDLPKLYYKTAMTAYSIICYIFIFLTLFLNVYILFYIKTDEEENEGNENRESTRNNEPTASHRNSRSSYTAKSAPVTESVRPKPHQDPNWLIIGRRVMDKLRRNAHWTLLTLFLLTKFIYWVTLLSMHYSY